MTNVRDERKIRRLIKNKHSHATWHNLFVIHGYICFAYLVGCFRSFWVDFGWVWDVRYFSHYALLNLVPRVSLLCLRRWNRDPGCGWTPTSFPGSTPLSRWRPREDPGTHRYTPSEILQVSWSILSRDTIEFRFRYTWSAVPGIKNGWRCSFNVASFCVF